MENVTTLQRQPLLNEANCKWYKDPESEDKREMREILFNTVSPVKATTGYRTSSHCNIIMEARDRHNLPPIIDSRDVVQKVYRHLMDRMQNKVPVKRQVNCPRQPQHVMNTLCLIALVQGWDEDLVAKWNTLPFRRLMKDNIKRTVQFGNNE